MKAIQAFFLYLWASNKNLPANNVSVVEIPKTYGRAISKFADLGLNFYKCLEKYYTLWLVTTSLRGFSHISFCCMLSGVTRTILDCTISIHRHVISYLFSVHCANTLQTTMFVRNTFQHNKY